MLKPCPVCSARKITGKAKSCLRCYHESLRDKRLIATEDAVELLFAGATLAQIAQRMGVSAGRVAQILLPWRKRKQPGGGLTRVMGVYVGHGNSLGDSPRLDPEGVRRRARHR